MYVGMCVWWCRWSIVWIFSFFLFSIRCHDHVRVGVDVDSIFIFIFIFIIIIIIIIFMNSLHRFHVDVDLLTDSTDSTD